MNKLIAEIPADRWGNCYNLGVQLLPPSTGAIIVHSATMTFAGTANPPNLPNFTLVTEPDFPLQVMATANVAGSWDDGTVFRFNIGGGKEATNSMRRKTGVWLSQERQNPNAVDCSLPPMVVTLFYDYVE